MKSRSLLKQQIGQWRAKARIVCWIEIDWSTSPNTQTRKKKRFSFFPDVRNISRTENKISMFFIFIFFFFHRNDKNTENVNVNPKPEPRAHEEHNVGQNAFPFPVGGVHFRISRAETRSVETFFFVYGQSSPIASFLLAECLKKSYERDSNKRVKERGLERETRKMERSNFEVIDRSQRARSEFRTRNVSYRTKDRNKVSGQREKWRKSFYFDQTHVWPSKLAAVSLTRISDAQWSKARSRRWKTKLLQFFLIFSLFIRKINSKIWEKNVFANGPIARECFLGILWPGTASIGDPYTSNGRWYRTRRLRGFRILADS